MDRRLVLAVVRTASALLVLLAIVVQISTLNGDGKFAPTGTGYYRDAFQPAETATMSVDDHERRMLEEVTVGIAGTGVRAGLIGELGTSGDAITPREERVLIAAGRVQRVTNVPVMVHTEGRRHVGLAAIRLLEANGANPARIHICHVNGASWWKDIVDTGASIGHDCFGSTSRSTRRRR